MNNIFLLASGLTQEDRFTAYLHYLIENIPEIGQDIVNFMSTQAGKPPSRFIRAVDHPWFSLTDRPDFLFECEDYDIICEHKIESGLGEKQLERYLALDWNKRFYLGLITKNICAIPSEVINKDIYLRPDSNKINHFRWQDIYPIIAKHPERLAQDFTEYMQFMGMRIVDIDGWTDLFTNPATASKFRKVWKVEIESYFTKFNSSCTNNPKDIFGIQVKNTLPWLHLLYFTVCESLKTVDTIIKPPYLCATIWTFKEDPRLDIFRNINLTLNYEGGTIATTHNTDVKPWKIKLPEQAETETRLALQYYTSLAELISEDLQQTQRRLLGFATTVFTHTKQVAEAAATACN